MNPRPARDRLFGHMAITAEVRDQLLDAHRAEVLREAADLIEREEAAEYPGAILGAIRRIRAGYFAAKLRRMADGGA